MICEHLNASHTPHRMHKELLTVVARGERVQDLRSEADILVCTFAWLDIFTLELH